MFDFKNSIKKKIALIFVVITVIPISIVGYYGYKSASNAYMENTLKTEEEKVQALSDDIAGFLDQIPKDLIYVANDYTLWKYLQWDDVGEKKKIKRWEKGTINGFYSFLESKQFYMKLRVIDKYGHEKIRINFEKISGRVSVTGHTQMQDRSDKPYFLEAMKLKRNEIYVSELSLNMEMGKIEKPYVPVIRYATPLIDENKITRGIVILNVYADEFLKLVAKEDMGGSTGHKYLVNKEGHFLYHEDKDKLWGFQLGHTASFKEAFPRLFSLAQNKSEGSILKSGILTSFKRIYPLEGNTDLYWTLYGSVNEKSALTKLHNFKVIFFAILISVLILVFFLSKKFINKILPPLLFVTRQMQMLSRGEILEEKIVYKESDEIGLMLTSSGQLLQNVKATIGHANAIAQGDYSKDVKLLSEKDELGKALNNMTKTLKEVTEIAQAVSLGDYTKGIDFRSQEDILGKAINRMTKNLRQITEIAQAVSVGDFTKEIELKSEADALGVAIKQMINNLREVVKQANAVALGDYSTTVTPRGEKDELGVALQTMTGTLSKNRRLNEEQNWLKDGLNDLKNELMGDLGVTEMARKALVFVAKYTGSAMGVLYIYDSKEETLKQYASYAFVEREELANRFKLGEGVVGQVGLQRSPILLKNIKREQATITTGTTSEPPLNSYTCPFIYEDELYGVMELASHELFDPLKQEFLSTSLSVIAVHLYSTSQTGRIKELLESSQAANEELQVQREELEEANTQMEEQRQQLEEQTVELKEKNEGLVKAQYEIDQRARDLELSNKYKSEFLANMSHELRTPLNSIILLSKVLSRNKAGNLTPEDVKKLGVVHSSGNELLTLIGDILDLSKVESGKMTLNVVEFSSSLLISKMWDMFEHEAQERGLEFKVQDDLKTTMRCDEEKLSQLVRNLLSNSFKFTKDGSVELKITNSEDPDRPVKISVADTGIGIPKDKQKLIFDAFHQVDGSTSRGYGGTGLGLSICREYAKLFKGEIDLKSEPEKGSEFTLLLPLALETSGQVKSLETNPGEPLKIERGESLQTDRFKKGTPVVDDRNSIKKSDKVILVIEDDRRFCEVLQITSQEAGFKSLIALTGNDGIALANEYLPSGIVLDLALPDVNGAEVLKTLKTSPKTRDIPVHIISGLEFDPSLIKSGAMGFARKPVKQENLMEILKGIVDISDKKHKDVLVVEDDEAQREAIIELIQDDVVKTKGTSSLSEALQELKKETYDAVVVDLGLKDGNGFELCRHIKENELAVPIIIYTARDLTQEEENVLKQYSKSIIAKTVHSDIRLKEELSLFLSDVHEEHHKRDELSIKEKQLEGKTILLVDDDTKNIFVLTSVLEEQGAHTLAAMNGQKAIDELNNNTNVDLILMDIMMPVMDGYEATRKIKADGKLKHIPVIALTAKAMKEDRAKCMEAGADDYISKPVNYEKLIQLLAAWGTR